MIEENLRVVLIASIAGTVAGAVAGAVVTAFLNNIRVLFLKSIAAVVFAWKRIVASWKWAVEKWRRRQALRIVEHNLSEETGIRILPDTLEQPQNRPSQGYTRRPVHFGTVEYPKWFNISHLAFALERLVCEGRAAKARRYRLDEWPATRVTDYLFRHVDRLENRTVTAEVEAIELDNLCLIYQAMSLCPLERRFMEQVRAETLAYNHSRHSPIWHKLDPVGPCGRCWDTIAGGEGLRRLVTKFLENELYVDAKTLSLIGEESSDASVFVEAVVAYCLDMSVDYEQVRVGLNITREALTIYERCFHENRLDEFGVETLKAELVGGYRLPD